MKTIATIATTLLLSLGLLVSPASAGDTSLTVEEPGRICDVRETILQNEIAALRLSLESAQAQQQVSDDALNLQATEIDRLYPQLVDLGAEVNDLRRLKAKADRRLEHKQATIDRLRDKLRQR